MSAVNTLPLSTEPYGAFLGEDPYSGVLNIALGVAPKVWEVRIPYSGYGSQGLQVFTPTRILSFSAGQVLQCTSDETQNRVVAIRVEDPVDYQINGQGPIGTLPAGSVTGVHHKIQFLQFPNGGAVEVM